MDVITFHDSVSHTSVDSIVEGDVVSHECISMLNMLPTYAQHYRSFFIRNIFDLDLGWFAVMTSLYTVLLHRNPIAWDVLDLECV